MVISNCQRFTGPVEIICLTLINDSELALHLDFSTMFAQVCTDWLWVGKITRCNMLGIPHRERRTDRWRESNREGDREGDREGERQTDGERERDTGTVRDKRGRRSRIEKGRDTERATETDRERERDQEGDRDRERM